MNSAGKIDQGVDWSMPWLMPVRDMGKQIASSANWRTELNLMARQTRLCNQRQLPIRFVTQQELPPGESYEAYIHTTGNVPTRDNLHDFFNALIWLTFPHIKAQLNALQAAQIARRGVGKSRGPSRDAATLFDENAALLAISDNPQGHSLAEALRNHQWRKVFVLQREQFKHHTKVLLFGHALMEKLVCPYKAITAHTLVCWVNSDFHQRPVAEQRTILDSQIAMQFESQQLLPNVFSPLPILGVPDWYPSQDGQFYADTSVFRPIRQR